MIPDLAQFEEQIASRVVALRGLLGQASFDDPTEGTLKRRGKRCGVFANDGRHDFGRAGALKGALRDVVSGNNGAYSAQPGWDACTGLGCPDGAKLLAALRGPRYRPQT